MKTLQFIKFLFISIPTAISLLAIVYFISLKRKYEDRIRFGRSKA